MIICSCYILHPFSSRMFKYRIIDDKTVFFMVGQRCNLLMCFPCCQHNHPVPVCLWRTHRFIHGTLFIWQESRSKGWTGLRELFPRRQELITPNNISPALMVWDLYLEEIEPDLGSLHLYAFQLRFKASLANFPGLNWSNSLPLADTTSMAFSHLWFAFVNTLNYNKKCH